MRRLALVLAVTLLVPMTAGAKSNHYSHRATVYSGACDHQTNRTADGTRLETPRAERMGILASSWLPMHALIRFDHLVMGKRYYRVRDTGGSFDLYVPHCQWPRGWNNPTLGFRIVR